MHLVWETIGAGGRRGDQRARPVGSYVATVGPEGDAVHGQWVWAVYDRRRGSEPVAEGFGYDEVDAKRAAAQCVRLRAPESFRQRLRSVWHRVA